MLRESGMDPSEMGGNGRQTRRFCEISVACPGFDRFGITLKQKLETGGSEMRQFARLACLAVAGLLVVAGLEAQKPAAKPASKAAAPKIEISPETKDAGTVAKGQVVDAVFVVKNTGGADLVISDARPSCGCTVASFDKVIKPGAEGKIQSSVDTKSFSGPISKSVLVVSNDPERPQMNLFIKALVKPFVDVLPQAFVRFSVIKGDSAGQDVLLFSEEKGFRPTIAETSQPYVKAEILPAGDKDKIAGRAGDQYKVRINVTPDAPEGLLNAPIRVATGVAQQPTVEIPVSGIVRPRVSVTPVT